MGRGTARSAVEGLGWRVAPPPCFAWSPSPSPAATGRTRWARVPSGPLRRFWLAQPLGEQPLEGGEIGAGRGAEVQRMLLLAEPDAQRALAGGFLDGEAPDLAIGIGAGLDLGLEQMLVLDEQDPPGREQHRAGRRGEGGEHVLVLEQMRRQPGGIAGADGVDIEDTHAATMARRAGVGNGVR